MRNDQRQPDQLRPVSMERNFTRPSPGSVLIRAGATTVLCTASVDESVPPWRQAEAGEGETPSGWVTAEYSMLPGSTAPRKPRRADGRSNEIRRLIGRSLRAVVDLAALGPRTIVVDCDVLEADGGTRTAAVTGGFVALADAVASLQAAGLLTGAGAIHSSVAAVSTGIVDGRVLLDLDYSEDSRAEVDLNVVQTGAGGFVELQGTAEGRAFGKDRLMEQLDLAEAGIAELTRLQRDALGEQWPLD